MSDKIKSIVLEVFDSEEFVRGLPLGVYDFEDNVCSDIEIEVEDGCIHKIHFDLLRTTEDYKNRFYSKRIHLKDNYYLLDTFVYVDSSFLNYYEFSLEGLKSSKAISYVVTTYSKKSLPLLLLNRIDVYSTNYMREESGLRFIHRLTLDNINKIEPYKDVCDTFMHYSLHISELRLDVMEINERYMSVIINILMLLISRLHTYIDKISVYFPEDYLSDYFCSIASLFIEYENVVFMGRRRKYSWEIGVRS